MKNKGLLIHEHNVKDWVFGYVSALPTEVLQDNGQWIDYLPEFEKQYDAGYDTMACVTFASLNCLETLWKKKYKEDINFSDRFIAKISGTSKWGNYMNKVGETIRKKGLVVEADYPADYENVDSREEWYKPIPPEIVLKASEWLKSHKVRYEWVSLRKAEELATVLKYAPLAVAIATGSKQVDGIYQRTTKKSNHVVMLCGYEWGKYWLVFDHYRKYRKLAWNFSFPFVLRFDIIKEITHKKMLPDNYLLQSVGSEGTGEFAMSLDNKKMVGDLDKLLATWLMRTDDIKNRKGIDDKKTWDDLSSINLKREPL